MVRFGLAGKSFVGREGRSRDLEDIRFVQNIFLKVSMQHLLWHFCWFSFVQITDVCLKSAPPNSANPANHVFDVGINKNLIKNLINFQLIKTNAISVD